MGYRLGVDLGTTFTAAAVDDGRGPRMVGLGNRALQVPSVLFLAADGSWLCGEAAERRSGTEPDRVVREFKRRLGDTVPVLVGGRPFSPQALSAVLLRWVVATVTERQGAGPDEVVLTRPANWGGFKQELFAQVGALADVPGAITCTEPEAAALQYASREVLQPGARVVVYDLGGGTFDVCVLERSDTGFGIVGTPDGVEHLGGIDFDEAVFRHVVGLLGDQVAGLDPDDGLVTAGLARLRRDCVEAKEALSVDVEAVVPVALPGISTSVRLTRTELEELIGPALRETVAATRRALRSSATETGQLAAVVLVGGSSRIPLVSQLLQGELGVRTAMDTHPKHDIALGAVLHHASAPVREPRSAPAAAAAAPSAGPAAAPSAAPASPAPAPSSTPPPATSWPSREAGGAPPQEIAAPGPQPPEADTQVLEPVAPDPVTRPSNGAPPPAPVLPRERDDDRPSLGGRLWWLVAAAVALVVVAAGGIWWLLGDDGSGPRADPAPEEPTDTGGGVVRLARSAVLVAAEAGEGEDVYKLGDGPLEALGLEGVAPGLPSISPDRRFVYFRTGAAVEEFEQNVLDLSSGTVQPMVAEPPAEAPDAWCPGRPAFHPDGDGTVALLCRVGEDQLPQVLLGRMEDDGQIGELVPIPGLSAPRLGALSYAGDGVMVLVDKDPAAPGVYAYPDASASGAGEPELIASGEADHAAGSVDGVIAYESGGTLRTVALDGSEEPLRCPVAVVPDEATGASVCILTSPDQGFATQPTWSRDGDQVLFNLQDAEEDETAELMKIDLTGSGEVVPVDEALGDVVTGASAWAPR